MMQFNSFFYTQIYIGHRNSHGSCGRLVQVNPLLSSHSSQKYLSFIVRRIHDHGQWKGKKGKLVVNRNENVVT
jgi:hypothetical protein